MAQGIAPSALARGLRAARGTAFKGKHLAGLAAFVRLIDRLNDMIGRGTAWLTLAMVLITFAVVILRYIYAVGWVWMQESYVWLHGIMFMIAAG